MKQAMDVRWAKAKDLIDGLAADLLACLRFYSRLPLPPFGFESSPYGAEISARIKMLPVSASNWLSKDST